MIPPDSKKCTKCGEVKPLEMFYRHKQMNDGRNSSCIECAKAQATASYLKKISTEEGRSDLHQKAKAQRVKHRAKRKTAKQRWAKDNPDKIAAKQRRRNLKNPKKNRERVLKWQRAHPAEVAARSKKDREKVSDSYIANLLGITVEILRLHPDYIKAKRRILLNKRYITNKKQEHE